MITALQRAVASRPRYGYACFRLGIALEKLGDIRGAIVAYGRPTKLLPSLAEAWFRDRRPGSILWEVVRQRCICLILRKFLPAGVPSCQGIVIAWATDSKVVKPDRYAFQRRFLVRFGTGRIFDGPQVIESKGVGA